MSEFYFKVGEEAILKSDNQPEKNGDCTIIFPVAPGDDYKCPHCGESGRLILGARQRAGYFLNIPSGNNCCAPWGQKSLRKKHKPGESFDSLMSSLKMTDKV